MIQYSIFYRGEDPMVVFDDWIFKVCNILSTTQFSVWIRSVKYSISIFRLLQNSWDFFKKLQPLLSD